MQQSITEGYITKTHLRIFMHHSRLFFTLLFFVHYKIIHLPFCLLIHRSNGFYHFLKKYLGDGQDYLRIRLNFTLITHLCFVISCSHISSFRKNSPIFIMIYPSVNDLGFRLSLFISQRNISSIDYCLSLLCKLVCNGFELK